MTLPAHAYEAPPCREPSGRLGLSGLCLPWTPQKSSHAADAEAACRERSIELGLIRNPDDLWRFDGIASAGAYAYPTAQPEHLEVCIDFLAWLWYLDDTYDEDRSFGERLDLVSVFLHEHLDVLRTGILPPEPGSLAAFTLDLRSRLVRLPRRKDAWMRRFTASVEAHLFQGSMRAVQYRASGAVPTVAEYLAMREQDSGMHACIDLIEIVEELFVPAEVHDDARVTRLRQLTARVVALTNDLFSYEREVLWLRDPNNIVRVLMEHHRLSFDDAVDETVRRINDAAREFTEIEKGFSRRPGIRAYIEGMKRWMRGNHDWSMQTRRYRSPDSPFPELRIAAGTPSSRRKLESYLRLVGT